MDSGSSPPSSPSSWPLSSSGKTYHLLANRVGGDGNQQTDLYAIHVHKEEGEENSPKKAIKLLSMKRIARSSFCVARNSSICCIDPDRITRIFKVEGEMRWSTQTLSRFSWLLNLKDLDSGVVGHAVALDDGRIYSYHVFKEVPGVVGNYFDPVDANPYYALPFSVRNFRNDGVKYLSAVYDQTSESILVLPFPSEVLLVHTLSKPSWDPMAMDFNIPTFPLSHFISRVVLLENTLYWVGGYQSCSLYAYDLCHKRMINTEIVTLPDSLSQNGLNSKPLFFHYRDAEFCLITLEADHLDLNLRGSAINCTRIQIEKTIDCPKLESVVIAFALSTETYTFDAKIELIDGVALDEYQEIEKLIPEDLKEVDEEMEEEEEEYDAAERIDEEELYKRNALKERMKFWKEMNLELKAARSSKCSRGPEVRSKKYRQEESSSDDDSDETVNWRWKAKKI